MVGFAKANLHSLEVNIMKNKYEILSGAIILPQSRLSCVRSQLQGRWLVPFDVLGGHQEIMIMMIATPRSESRPTQKTAWLTMAHKNAQMS